MRKTVVGGLMAAATVALAGSALGSANQSTLVSRATGANGAKGGGTSSPGNSAISANGRFVVFGSDSTNLVPADSDAHFDIYVRDLKTGTTTLASVSSNETKSNSDSGLGGSAISADGTKVAFDSTATNLDPADSDNSPDVYVRDLTAGTTTLVSVAT